MMHLTDKDKQLIKTSYMQLMENELNLANCFYGILFEMAPLIKPLFKGDPQLLEMHFNELIHVAVEHVDQFDELKSSLYELGQKHKGYGAKEHQFEIVKSALLLSIEYELKSAFNAEVKNAWANYIEQIAQVMMKGLSSK